MARINKQTTRRTLFKRQNGKCFYCDCFLKKLNIPITDVKTTTLRHATLDHLIPKSQGGSDKISNLALACLGCNQDRGDQDYKKFREKKLCERVVLTRRFRVVKKVVQWLGYEIDLIGLKPCILKKYT